MRKIISQIKLDKKQFGLLLLVISASFLLANYTQATWVTDILSGIASAIVYALGLILIMLMKILIYIAQYNGFIKSGAVSNGWVIVRDLCNMFFVVILLVISFATILQKEEYSIKKWLPKLVMMAILINFSKTICGLIIDFGQVVMLTFVNAFKDIGGGNLTSMLGITDWMEMKESGSGSTEWEVLGAYVLAIIYVIISVVVITTMIAMLVMRMVMLWVYIVLSPAAYLLATFPGGKQYSTKWWSEFIKNVIVGPVLCFFIWLSFVTITPGTSGQGALDMKSPVDTPNMQSVNANSTLGTSDLMVKFIISIGMLIGGLKISQEIGGAAGSMAGSGMAALNKGKAMGMKGVAAVTGARYVSGVMGKYSSEKKARREEKYSAMANRFTSAEANIRGNIKGTIKGAKNIIKGKAKDLSLYAQAKATGKTKEEIIQQQEKKSEANSKRKETKKYEEKARYDAYSAKKYTDKNGTEFQEHVTADGTVKYRDEKTGEFAKDSQGKEVTKMSDTHARFKGGIDDGLTRARALKNQLVEGKMGKQQKLLEDSGASTTDLMRIMKDGGASKDKRAAAAMTLAIKEGFKNKDVKVGRQNVSAAKNVLGDNPLMLKKFNETINKRFAHLNFDLDNDDGTINAAGQNKFKQAMDNGQVEGYRLDNTAYKDKNLLSTLKDYSGIDFDDNINSVAKRSKQDRINVGDGLKGLLKDDLSEKVIEKKDAAGNTILDAQGNPETEKVSGKLVEKDSSGKETLNKNAKLVAKITGDYKAAFSDDKGFNKDAAKLYFKNATASNMKSFDPSQLDVKPDGSNQSFIDDLKEVMAEGLTVNTLVSMAKTDQSPDLLRHILIAIRDSSNSSPKMVDKKKAVANNNTLNNTED